MEFSLDFSSVDAEKADDFRIENCEEVSGLRSSTHPDLDSPLYFDLETVPDWERARLLGIEPVEESRPTPIEDHPDCGELLRGTIDDIRARLAKLVPDPDWLQSLQEAETIGKSRKGILDAIKQIKEHGSAFAVEREKQVKLLSTCPDLCRIVAFAWSLGGRVESLVVRHGGAGPAFGSAGERALLLKFWKLARDRTPCGFGISFFDLPVIACRSIVLGIPPTRQFDLSPWKSEIIDLYHMRFGRNRHSSGQPGDLKSLATIYGFNPPAGDVDGSQVYRLWLNDQHKTLAKYCESDVELCMKLHQLWAGYF